MNSSHLCESLFFRVTKYFPAVITIAVLLSLAGCTTEPSGTTAEQILRSAEGGDFRGVSIGDDRNEVRNAENATSVYSMPDELVYRIDPGGKDSTWYEISYNFNQAGLYDINLEIYPKSDSGISQLKNDFISYYLNKYGDCKYYNGYCQWRAMTENGHIVSITLTDTISDQPRPCLKVNFNESN